MAFLILTTLLSALGSLPLTHAVPIPTVSFSNGTVLGSSISGVDTFWGIPYARPPVGDLRFRAPVALDATFGTLNATSAPAACPQLPSDYDPVSYTFVEPSVINQYIAFSHPDSEMSEDCLTLNIQRPSSTTSESKLPVVVWIYGGGFNQGSNKESPWERFVTDSVSISHPVLVVAINYRLAAFGFLGGSQIQAEEGSNVGLRDQRLALKWVADNIEAFGGDPDNVTIWGESAGAWSVLYQMLIEGGDNTYNGKPLFHGGIMNSGAGLPATPTDGAEAQGSFDAIVQAAGCSTEAVGEGNELECLRQMPWDAFNNVTDVVPSLFTYTGVVIAFPPRPDPSDSFFPLSPEAAIRQGKIARVPIITGNQADEGALFAITLYNGTTTDKFVNGNLNYTYPSAPVSVLTNFVNTYSTDPAEGAPYGTGDNDVLYLNSKRNAAVIGDLLFEFQRRHLLEHTADLIPAWSYSAVYNRTTNVLGTAHGTDLALFGNQKPEVAYKHISQWYLSFINYQDPNKIDESFGYGSRLTHWPRYTAQGKAMIQFDVKNESIIRDDYRQQSYDYFKTVISSIKI
ncbi:Alpha/Beta hydrolase protein [Xylariaceae sp. FL1272]|nr:Alpha/Beta hydrolase protein [Xylariaceae sp. FL1272]